MDDLLMRAIDAGRSVRVSPTITDVAAQVELDFTTIPFFDEDRRTNYRRGRARRMIRWIVLIGLLGFGGYVAYDYYMAGYHTRPEMPEGAFSVSYKSGLRGILIDITEEDTRRYLGVPMEVPFYLKESWSWCHAPKGEEIAQAASFMTERDWPGQRFEAVCKIVVEGQEVVRGLIISVPKV